MSAHQAELSEYARTRDAEAFARIVDAYQGLVYGVCLRMLGNTADAEDAAQECFLALARRAGDVRTSVAGWLHYRATHYCITRQQRESARRAREAEYGRQHAAADNDPTWERIAPAVDQAMLELRPDERDLLIAHFLQRQSQTQIAAELGMSAATVSRRVRDAVEALRAKLAKAGVLATAAPLAPSLLEQLAPPVPAALAENLAKMAIAGPGKVSIGVGWGKLAAVIVAGLLTVGSAIIVQQVRTGGATTGPAPGAATTTILARSETPMPTTNAATQPLDSVLPRIMADPPFLIGPARPQTERAFDHLYFASAATMDQTDVVTAQLMAKLTAARRDARQIDIGPVVFIHRGFGIEDPYTLQIGAVVPAGTPAQAGAAIQHVEPFACVSMVFCGSLYRMDQAAQQLLADTVDLGYTPIGEFRVWYPYFEDNESPNNIMILQCGVSEVDPAPTDEPFSVEELRVQTLETFDILCIDAQAAPGEIPQALSHSASKLVEIAQAGGVKLIVPQVVIYDRAPLGSEPVTMKVGRIVATGTTAPAGGQVQSLGNFHCASALYHGSMADLPKGIERAAAAITARRLTITGQYREYHLDWNAPESSNKVILMMFGVEP